MQLLYSYIGRLRVCTKNLVSLYKYIFRPANKGHRLVMPGRYFLPSLLPLLKNFLPNSHENRSIPCLTVLICFMLFSAPAVQSRSVETPAASLDTTPLKIGERIPEELWNLPMQVVNHPNGKETITLNDYRDKKLIILDFWATWCGSCVAAMPKIDSLNNEFEDDVIILPISYQESSIVKPFIAKNQKLNELKLISILDYPKPVKEIFPHRLLPHYVWISPTSGYITSTSGDEVKKENIKNYLTKGLTQALDKKIDLDLTKPLFLDEDIVGNRSFGYSILMKGKYSGLPSGNRYIIKSNGDTIGRTLTNQPLLTIYESVARQLFKEAGDFYTHQNRLLFFNDSTEWIRDYSKDFPSERYYTYSIRSNGMDNQKLHHLILEDLNKFSELQGSIESRTMNCYEIVSKNNVENIRSRHDSFKETLFDDSGPRQLFGASMKYFVQYLNGLSFMDRPVVDATDVQFMVDIDLGTFHNLETLEKALKANNLLLRGSKREIRLLIINDKN